MAPAWLGCAGPLSVDQSKGRKEGNSNVTAQKESEEHVERGAMSAKAEEKEEEKYCQVQTAWWML